MEKTAIHCPTQELWNKVVEKTNSKIGNWWHYSKQDSCLNLYENDFTTYGSIDSYKENNYKIIQAEEFLKQNTMKKQIKYYEVIKSVPFTSSLNKGATIVNSSNFEECAKYPEFFKPIYKQEFKVGDWVIGWHCSSTFQEKAWQIGKISIGYIYPVGVCNNTTTDGLRKATEEEIKAAQRIEIGGCELKFYQDSVEIDGVIYSKDRLKEFINYILFHNEQIKGLVVGCNGQFTIGIDKLKEIKNKL